MPTPAEKRAAFRRLHASGCFVIPNPWDIGTTRYLQNLGFKALATTSAGFAWSRGFADGGVPRDMMLAHIAELSAAADVPMNADFEGGYAHEPAGVAESVRLCVATGVSGLSIEDYTGDMANPLYDFDTAVARMRAARAAIDKAGGDVLLTGRSEGFIRNRADMAETIRRLKAYADAGADCLYAPGIKTREEIAAVVKGVAPKPVNFLMGGRERSHRARPRRARRAAHQRRRCAGALGVGRAHAHGQGDRRPRQLQGLRRCGAGRRHRQRAPRLSHGAGSARRGQTLSTRSILGSLRSWRV